MKKILALLLVSIFILSCDEEDENKFTQLEKSVWSTKYNDKFDLRIEFWSEVNVVIKTWKNFVPGYFLTGKYSIKDLEDGTLEIDLHNFSGNTDVSEFKIILSKDRKRITYIDESILLFYDDTYDEDVFLKKGAVFKYIMSYDFD